MSGKFNQVGTVTKEGIVWHVPQRKGGQFDMYQTQIKVIVSGSAKKPVIHLTNAVFETLDKARYIRLGTMGSDVILMGTDKADGAYSVMIPKDEKGEPSGTRFLNCVSFIRAQDIRRGVYNARIEEGMVIFNKDQKPAEL